MSGHGKSKGNYDTSLDENIISNIDIEKTNEIKKDDDNIKLQNNKSKAKVKKLVKQWVVKKFGWENFLLLLWEWYRLGWYRNDFSFLHNRQLSRKF